MKLLRFRVTNFRSVEDSGWINLSDVTALIGVNESGKTNLLTPLWKFNPAREGEIVPVADYPKPMYGIIRENPSKYCFMEAIFDANDIAQEISKLTGYAKRNFSEVRILKYYDGEFRYAFPNSSVVREYDIDKY